MKILMVSNIFPPGFIGGYELGALEVLRDLVKRGHDVKVLTSDYFNDESGELADFDVERVLENVQLSHELIDPQVKSVNGFYYNFNNIRKLSSKLRTFKPDVVLLFNIMGLGVLSIIKLLEKVEIPTILYLMDNPFREIDRETAEYKAYGPIFGAVRFSENIKIVAMSHSLMREVSASIGIETDNVMFIPGWIHLPDYSAELVSHEHNDDVRFVFSSSVAPHKGTEILIEAADQLIRAGFRNFYIDVYGPGLVTQFLQSVRMKGLDSHIRYHGCKSKEEMVGLFSQYDALLFPTWEREPFGFVVSEAAAAGCFPIMTDGIGAGEWFNDGVDCIKISRTPEALMNAMLRTISMPSNDRLKLRNAAMQSARENFASEKWMSAIEQICFDMKEKKPADVYDASRQIQSAFLFLGDMWKKSLNIHTVVSEQRVSMVEVSNSYSSGIPAKSSFENILWEYGMKHAKAIKKIPLISSLAEKFFFKLADKR